MNTSQAIAKNFHDVNFGGNWTSVNLTDTLSDLSWNQATTSVYSFNTIATLVFHMNYYVDVLIKVLQGEGLNAKDEYSFNHPPVNSKEDWDKLIDKTYSDARELIKLIEQFPDENLEKIFIHEKYGTYYRNLTGVIEHIHYHLGQIVLIKKILRNSTKE